MKTVKATDAKQKFGELIDMAQKEAVTITSHGRSVAVLVSAEEYEREQVRKWKLLKARLDKSVAQMESGGGMTTEQLRGKLGAGGENSKTA